MFVSNAAHPASDLEEPPGPIHMLPMTTADRVHHGGALFPFLATKVGLTSDSYAMPNPKGNNCLRVSDNAGLQGTTVRRTTGTEEESEKNAQKIRTRKSGRTRT